jgi:hypothetical protein
MLGPHQPVCRRAQFLRPEHHFDHVRLAVSHVHQPRIRHVGRHFRYALIAFNPACTFFLAGAHAIGVALLACPHPCVEYAQRLALARHRVGRMQIHTAPRFVIQRPQSSDFLAVEIKFGRVLNTQHNRLLAHAFLCARPMRRQNAFPGHIRIAQKTVGCARLAPAIASLRDTGRRFGRKSFHHFLRPSVEAGVTQIHSCKFLLSPLLCRLRHAPAQIAKVNAIRPKFTSAASNSLNVNGSWISLARSIRMCITLWGRTARAKWIR